MAELYVIAFRFYLFYHWLLRWLLIFHFDVCLCFRRIYISLFFRFHYWLFNFFAQIIIDLCRLFEGIWLGFDYRNLKRLIFTFINFFSLVFLEFSIVTYLPHEKSWVSYIYVFRLLLCAGLWTFQIIIFFQLFVSEGTLQKFYLIGVHNRFRIGFLFVDHVEGIYVSILHSSIALWFI